MRKLLLSALLAGLIARTAQAADIGLSIEVPRLDVAEYHRPYVAIWIENPDQSVATGWSGAPVVKIRSIHGPATFMITEPRTSCS